MLIGKPRAKHAARSRSSVLEIERRHCEEPLRRSNPAFFAARWIASRSLSSGAFRATRWLAMTVSAPHSPAVIARLDRAAVRGASG